MDIHHLTQDELDSEFLIRGIVDRGEAGMNILAAAIEAETSGEQAMPHPPSGLRISSETRACRQKLETIREDVSKMAQQADDSGVPALQSRLIHLSGRIQRLNSVEFTFAVNSLVKELEDLRVYFESVRKSLGADETLFDQDEPGAGYVPSSVQDCGNRSTTPDPELNEVSQHQSQQSASGLSFPTTTQSVISNSLHAQGIGQRFINDVFLSQRSSMPFSKGLAPLVEVTPPNGDNGIVHAMRVPSGNICQQSLAAFDLAGRQAQARLARNTNNLQHKQGLNLNAGSVSRSGCHYMQPGSQHDKSRHQPDLTIADWHDIPMTSSSVGNTVSCPVPHNAQPSRQQYEPSGGRAIQFPYSETNQALPARQAQRSHAVNSGLIGDRFVSQPIEGAPLRSGLSYAQPPRQAYQSIPSTRQDRSQYNANGDVVFGNYMGQAHCLYEPFRQDPFYQDSFPAPQPQTWPYAPQPHQPYQPQQPNHGARPGYLHLMSKWNIKYCGSSTDMHVDEFLFRAETLSRSANIDLDMLPLGMHYLLHGAAQEWFWVFHRDTPMADWNTFMDAMRNQFAPFDNEFEIWDKVRSRKQGPNEDFSQFHVAVTALTSRLRQRLSERNMVELLRSNMKLELKNALLYYQTPTVRDLQSAAKQHEKLRISSVEVARRVNELVPTRQDYHSSQASYPRQTCPAQDFTLHYATPDYHVYQVQEPSETVEAVTNPSLLICWNCDEMGHTFHDCVVATRNVFCYGCGVKNTYKPNCSRCSPGNARAGGPIQPPVRSNQNAARPNQGQIQVLKKSNPFTRS